MKHKLRIGWRYTPRSGTYGEKKTDFGSSAVAGGECILTLRDTTLIPDFAGDTYFDATDILTQSDFYVVTQADVDQGFMVIPFLEPYTASPEAYMIGLEMYSNGNTNDTYILAVSYTHLTLPTT